MEKSAFSGKPSAFSERVFFIHDQDKPGMRHIRALFLDNTCGMAQRRPHITRAWRQRGLKGARQGQYRAFALCEFQPADSTQAALSCQQRKEWSGQQCHPRPWQRRRWHGASVNGKAPAITAYGE
ncbi:hypothetical protein [Janthinobacterium sp. NKUCC08_JDC]|uniref:hypothetical protein n=1 Tax=Janthinobacterium sp. NKUCC08_JDC TaxID=2842122 RepID=UPI001C5B013A|nr:hypothetical protein [Janthinobacterium sp. NKUCC08_JDC]MBW3497635.1 hypothetical protein [Janthinobacterium sp. NKUCC08_JDC]